MPIDAAVPLAGFRNGDLVFPVDDTGGLGGFDTPVVLLHGFPQTRASWRSITPALSQRRYRVLAPDQRGYAPDARPSGRRSYALPHLVGDVVALLDTIEAEQVHLVGHDWGGAVAWAFAETHPERLRSVSVLSTPHPRAMLRAALAGNQLAKSWYMFAFQPPVVPEAVLRSRRGTKLFRAALSESGMPAGEVDAAVALMCSDAATGILNWYRAVPFGAAVSAHHITVPTLYVYGARDIALGRAAADFTARWIRGPYRYDVLPDAGHWLIDDAPDQVVAALLDHFEATDHL